MWKLILLFLLLLVGCAKEPDDNRPLPPNEIEDIIIYENIKNIHKNHLYVEATILEGKRVRFLKSSKYKIVIDSDKEPWWEETEWKKYCNKSILGKVRICSYLEKYVTIHLSKLEDLK